MNEARFGGGRHHGETDRRSGGIKVQQQSEGKTVADVGREIKVVTGGFAVLVARGDLAGGGVDQHVERLGKRGSALDVVVADELKDLALGEDCGVVVEGTVAKVKSEAGGDAVSMADLNKIAHGEGLAFLRFEN